ncbi:hypothetical protein fugu_009545 [Takifugu bimaculatus]|uniref:Uncharacterized protein n=1 Tax=Takifugu bimaculatus TaxID=433685 RepID=A0A4Z2CCT1_9TELE|nr:hypothetical protein fugu_009545 [Takifugu bimaculatus]
MMSCTITNFFILLFVTAHVITAAEELDGSAIDTCMIFPVPDLTTVTNTKDAIITPVTTMQVVTTTTSNLERIKQPPLVTRPITNHHSDLLRILLENIRHHVNSQPRLTGFISQQHKKTSDSSESAAQQGSLSSDSSNES